jgi:probable HAF family extracellular repeat protein
MKYSYACAAVCAVLLSGCAGSSAVPTNTAPFSPGAANHTAAALAVSSAYVPRYHVVALNALGGSFASGISDNEQDWISGYSLLPDNATLHATLWYATAHNAADLSTLGGANSAVEWPNHLPGTVVGISQIAQTDPLGEQWSCSYPAGYGFLPYTGQECRGFVWMNGAMKPLGTLGGNNSFAAGSSQAGQMVGWAETAVHDSTCNAPQVLQFEAVRWDRAGRAVALPPLPGDPDSAATAINDAGNAVGISGICENAVGALSAEHMVLWHGGVPMQLPSFGGSAWNTPEMINDENDVVGFSDFPGDQNGSNFNGHAFLWTAREGTVDLGVLSGDAVSFAYSVNDLKQIVGQSCTAGCGSSRAFLYQRGKMYDLNALLDAASSSYDLIFANDVNDEGQITGLAVDRTSGAIVAYRLVVDGEILASSVQAVTLRPDGALNYHVHLGPFGRPIVTR